MRNRFQYFLSLSVFAILLIGFFVYSLWIEGILYNNQKNQALKDNLIIGETVLGILDKSQVTNDNREDFIKIVQETCDVLKLPNNGFLCMMDSTGVLIAAPGLIPSKEIRISEASFHSKTKDKKYSFAEFFSLEPFSGYYEYEEIGYSDIVVAINHRFSGYKLMVHQDANLIKEQARSKSRTILFVGLGFATLLSVLSYFIIKRQVRTYQFRIEIQNKQLVAVNEEIQSKNGILENQNQKLVEFSEEKDALLGIMAHDLRNPIGGIQSVINLVDASGNLNDEQLEYFRLLKSQVKSAQVIITDVLEMNRLESDKKELQKEKIDLVQLIEAKSEFFAPLADKKRIKIIRDVSCSEFWLTTGVSELHRIIDNLLSNSIKYSPQGEVVTISLIQNMDFVELNFIDKGQGIKDKELDLLFKKFSKLSTIPTDDEESSGLGLYIVKLLSDKIGADVYVESTFGKGSKFSLNLPLSI